MCNTPDEVIMRRLVAGDSEALDILYSRHAGLVGGIACRVLRDMTEAEDVVQTVFIQAWRLADRYDAARGTVRAWLCMQARTRAVDARRKRLSRRETCCEHEASSTAGVSAVERVAVHQALRVLSQAQRETIELAYFEGLTHTEIADRLGQPLGTVKTRARSALGRMRERLTLLPGDTPRRSVEPGSRLSVSARRAPRDGGANRACA